MAWKNLNSAKEAQKNEFYTQYFDIQREINVYLEYDSNVFRDKTILLPCDDPEWSNFTKFFAQNFENFGLKKLISTSFATDSKNYETNYQPTLFETENPKFDKKKTRVKWKIFVLDHDTNQNWKIDIDDLEWDYLEWDWDFRSDEIKKLRDEADIIITNPPFSLFREFVAWIMEAKKGFVIIWNQNAIPVKQIFPLIKNNKMWLWKWFPWWAGHFISNYSDYAVANDHKEWMIRVSWVVRFTNLDHWRRHQPLWLMTMADNIKFSKHKEINGVWYLQYEDYDAIDVPYTDAIPSDYEWIMWVPISFMDKYNPDQFEILDCDEPCIDLDELRKRPNFKEYQSRQIKYNDKICQKTYHRIFIRKK